MSKSVAVYTFCRVSHAGPVIKLLDRVQTTQCQDTAFGDKGRHRCQCCAVNKYMWSLQHKLNVTSSCRMPRPSLEPKHLRKFRPHCLDILRSSCLKSGLINTLYLVCLSRTTGFRRTVFPSLCANINSPAPTNSFSIDFRNSQLNSQQGSDQVYILKFQTMAAIFLWCHT